MTLPPHFTTLDLSGRFTLNPTLSDKWEDILETQGVSDAELRRSLVSGMLSFNQYKDEDSGLERIWVQQDFADSSRSRVADSEDRTLDWYARTRDDPLFGPTMSRMRRIKTSSLNPQFLREGWTSDTRRYGVLEYILSTASNSNKHNWSTVETWGVEVNRTGERRFARHIRLTGPGGLELERHLVYNYLGEIL